jgi:hypothetical protein
MGRAFLLTAILLWPAPATAQSVYFGTLHSHTSYSDGSGTPAEAYAMAKGAGLDFFAITEHNHRRAEDGAKSRRDGKLIATNPLLYAGQPSSLIETANRLNQPGQFVTLYGQEISTISSGNHMNVFQVGSVVDDVSVPNGKVPALLTWVGAHPDSLGQTALLQFNHPNNPSSSPKDYGRDDYAPADWVRSVDPFVELIEVLNAPALDDGLGFRAEAKEGYYFEYLNLGFHVAPSVGHDNHWKNWGKSTDARIGVIADALTRGTIMSALRARHTFASDDKNLKVIFRSGESLGGDIVPVPPPGTSLPLTVEISDPDEQDARYRVEVYTDHKGGDRPVRINAYPITGNTNGRYVLDGIAFDGPGQFVLLKIIQRSAEQGDSEHQEVEDRLWTAPIWYEAGLPALVITTAVRIADLLPNPVGEDLQNEAVSLTNAGASTVDLSGWQLRDESGNAWTIIGLVGPGQSVTVRRSGQPMSLNNSGDEIELINKAGVVVDTITYGRATEGAVVSPERMQ